MGGDDGEPHIIYHTDGLTRGLVIGYKNEAACAN